MDENLEMLIEDNKVDKLCGNNMVGIVKTVTLMKSNLDFFLNLGIADGNDYRVINARNFFLDLLDNR